MDELWKSALLDPLRTVLKTKHKDAQRGCVNESIELCVCVCDGCGGICRDDLMILWAFPIDRRQRGG